MRITYTPPPDNEPVPQPLAEPIYRPYIGGTATQYVVTTPPRTPVLRPIRQPLYDTEQFATGDVHRQFFVDNRRFNRGDEPKTQADTNMTQCGQLGYPLEFDMSGLGVILPIRASRHDLEEFVEEGVLEWCFGAATRWLTCALRALTPVMGLALERGTVEIERTHEDPVWPFYYADMRTPDRRARRISSTESFHGDVETRPLVLDEPRKLTLVMQGTLYTHL